MGKFWREHHCGLQNYPGTTLFFYFFLLEHVLLFVAKLQKRYKETLGEVWKVRAEGVTLKLVLEISGIFLFKRDFFAYFAKINGCNV